MMKIVQCKKCGRMIHATSHCYHCGSSSVENLQSFTEIHPNIQDEYGRISLLLQEKKYDEVIQLSDKIIEWMPKCAEVFWIRFLASHRCTNDLELICKGAVCKEDANYLNAVKYANDNQHKVYTDIQNKINAICCNLQKELELNTYERKVATRIVPLQQEIREQMDKRRKDLFDLWSELVRIEQKMYMQEMDCRLVSKEHQDMLETACSKVSAIKAETKKLEECTESQRLRFQIELDSLKQQSENAKNTLAKIDSQDSHFVEFRQLETLREKQVDAINTELTALKRYESGIRETILAFEQIERNHRIVSEHIQNAMFPEVTAFLGSSIFSKVLCEVGIVH